MKEYKIEIEGVAPLRMNRFTDEAKGTLEGGRKRLNEAEKKEEALMRTYRNDKGKFIIEGKALKACILQGGKRVKVGRRSAYGDLKAVLFTKGREILLTCGEPVLVEEVCKIPPKTGALVVKLFYVFEKWKAETTLIVTDDRFPDQALNQSIIEAGMYAGLLDGRPDYGRFVLKSFKKV